MTKQESCLKKEIMQETIPGARRRGRPRTAWRDNIKTWTGLPWKSQPERKRTGINGESTSMVWPTHGSRTAKEQDIPGSIWHDKYLGGCNHLTILWPATVAKNRLRQKRLPAFTCLLAEARHKITFDAKDGLRV